MMNQAKGFDFGFGKRSFGLSTIALGIWALGLVACGASVKGGGGGDGGAGGTSSSTGTAGNGGAGGNAASTAIALLYSQFPPPDPTSSGVSTSSSGGGPDPNTLYVMIGNYPIACADPFGDPCGHWQVSIGIPPALQVPSVIPLSSPDIISSYSVSEASCNSGSGGSFVQGTIEIVSIDQTEVVGKLANTETFEFDANGDFTAPRCP